MAWWSKRKDGSRIGRAQALAGTVVVLLVVLGPRLGDVVNAGHADGWVPHPEPRGW
jgi:hypothetical protein